LSRAPRPNLLVLLADLRGPAASIEDTAANVYYERWQSHGANLGEAVLSTYKGVAPMDETALHQLPTIPTRRLELVTADVRGLARRKRWGEANTFAKPGMSETPGASAIGQPPLPWRDG